MQTNYIFPKICLAPIHQEHVVFVLHQVRQRRATPMIHLATQNNSIQKTHIKKKTEQDRTNDINLLELTVSRSLGFHGFSNQPIYNHPTMRPVIRPSLRERCQLDVHTTDSKSFHRGQGHRSGLIPGAIVRNPDTVWNVSPKRLGGVETKGETRPCA